MKVVFRVDSSLVMGTGHVMRCLTLAQMLKENGADIEFICRKHKGNLIEKIRSGGLDVHELEVFEEIEFDICLIIFLLVVKFPDFILGHLRSKLFLLIKSLNFE